MIYPENENEVFDELHKYIKNFDRKKENRKWYLMITRN
jgi:hypothetical protein